MWVSRRGFLKDGSRTYGMLIAGIRWETTIPVISTTVIYTMLYTPPLFLWMFHSPISQQPLLPRP